jgi:hypothetical protein
LVLLGTILLWAVVTGFQRARSERGNNVVEISVEWDDVVELCRLNNYSLNIFLERAKAIGVTSIIVNEDTLASLSRKGEISPIFSSEFQKLQSLELLTPADTLAPNTLLVADADAAAAYTALLQLRYTIPVTVTRQGKYRVLHVSVSSPVIPGLWNENLPMGFSDALLRIIERQGFSVVLRPQNAGNPQWLSAINHPAVEGIILDGKEVPGYGGREQQLAALIKDQRWKFISVEFSTVFGSDLIKKMLPEKLVAGHTIFVPELLKNQNPKFWLGRWNRAVKERGNRFLQFHFWPQKSIEDNMAYLRLVAQELKQNSFRMAAALILNILSGVIAVSGC